jgi:hypothetical protein
MACFDAKRGLESVLVQASASLIVPPYTLDGRPERHSTLTTLVRPASAVAGMYARASGLAST